MSLAEGVSARVAYKAYATGAIQSNTQPVSNTDPGPSGAQTLRRVASTLKLAKDSYSATEIRSDRQTVDFRHGTRRVTGSITGEYSPGTYWDLFEASTRGTSAPPVTLTNTGLTSVVGDAATSTLQFGSGDPVALGLHVGSIFRLSGLTGPGAANNGVNFIACGFSGVTNSTVQVFPPPVTMAAELTFTLTTTGGHLIIPSTGFVSRKFAFETYHEDIAISRLFTECRVGGFTVTLPASGLATIEFPMMGRDMEVFKADTIPAPFFTAPAPETTTGIFAAVNGMLRVAGSVVGVVTGINFAMNLTPASDAVVGQDFVPEVFLGSAALTGQVTAMLEGADLINNFLNEDEIDILVYLTTTNHPGAPACSFYLPRVKFSDADVAVQGMGSQSLTLPFTALKYVGSAAGVPQTTIQFTDTEAT
jgi:hypothetical protein